MFPAINSSFPTKIHTKRKPKKNLNILVASHNSLYYAYFSDITRPKTKPKHIRTASPSIRLSNTIFHYALKRAL